MFAAWLAGFFACASIVLCLTLAWLEKERRRHLGRAQTWRNAYFQHVRATDRTVGVLRDEIADLRNKLSDAVYASGEDAERLKPEEAA